MRRALSCAFALIVSRTAVAQAPQAAAPSQSAPSTLSNTQTTAASPADAAPHLTIGTEIFTDYTFMTEPKGADAEGNPISLNAFDVTRAYINLAGRLSRRVAFRLTPDVVRETDSSSATYGSLVFRLKFGYGEIDLDQGGDHARSWIRFGLQPTPLILYEETIYRYRFQGSVFVDRVGALVDSDAGALFHTTLPNDYGEIEAGVFNGEGFASPETNGEKAIQIRGTVRPFAQGATALRGWRVTGFYDTDHYLQDAPRRRAVFNTTYEHTRFNAGFDYLDQIDQPLTDAALATHRGWSAWLTPFFRQKGDGPEMLLRYDVYRLERDMPETRRRAIVGFSYWFPHPAGSGTLALLLDLDQLTLQGFPPTPANANQRALAVHALIDY